MKIRPDRWLVAACLVCLAQPAAFPKELQHQPGANTSRPSESALDAAAAEPAAEAQARVTATVADLPMCFEPNAGQTDERVAFLSRTGGYGVFLTPDALVLALHRSANAAHGGAAKAQPEPLAPAVLRMHLVGATPSTPVGEAELETKTNYFVGSDPDRWVTDVPTFARVRYPDVYPGVDLVYRGAHDALEYDVVVAPGADPSPIAIEWEGADAATLDRAGDLVLAVGGSELRQHAPVLYQEDDAGGRRTVSGAFRALGGGRFGVEVGEYDRARPLVVDPVLTYSYTISGSSSNGVAVDSAGATYLTGAAFATGFPTYLGYDSTYNGGNEDALVAKLNSEGTALVYSTFLGGDDDDDAFEIALDGSGAAFVAGITSSDNFPMRFSFDNTPNGSYEGFVTKVGATGDSLVFSTYFGGTGYTEIRGIASDSSGALYMVGGTASVDFPTAGAYDSTINGSMDAFVTKLKPFSPFIPPYHVQIEYSTFVGGAGEDAAYDVAVDGSGAAVVVGETQSSNFPRTGHTTGLTGETDAFVTRLDASGAALSYSTCLGGSVYDGAGGVAIGSDGSLYVAGFTDSTDFPTTVGAYDRTYNGSVDLFVTKFRRTSLFLSPYVIDYSTYLGGSSSEYGWFDFLFDAFSDVASIAVDSTGAAVVVGTTASADYPLLGAIDSTFAPDYDIVVTKLRPAGNGLVYSTFLGGSDLQDHGRNVTLDASGAAYVTGRWNGALVAKIQ